MKKALIILLVLAVAGGLFAQNLALTGNVRSGMDLRFMDGKNTVADEAWKPTVNMGSQIADHPGRLSLSGAFNTEDGVAGIRFEMRINALANGNLGTGAGTSPTNADEFAQAVVAENYWGYIRFLDNIVEVSAGRGGPGGFGTMGGVDAGFDLLGGGRSTFGVLVKPLGNNDIQIGANVKGYGGGHTYSLREVERTWVGFGALYTMPNLFTGVVNFRTSYRNAYESGVTDGAWDIAAGVNVLALADLGISRLAVDFAVQNMDHEYMKKDGARGNGNGDLTDLQIGQRIAYSSGPLGAELRARQLFMLGVDTAKDKGYENYAPMLQFGAHVQYTMDNLVPRLDLGFIMNGQPNDNFRRNWDVVGRGPDFRRMGDDYSGRALYHKEAMGLALAPSLRINMTRSWIEFGYTMSYDLSTDRNDEGKGIIPKDNTKLRNMIYIDMQVNF